MEFAEEWKSLWPISSVFSPPLLMPNSNPSTADAEPEPPPKRRRRGDSVGPLRFVPSSETLVHLLTSPSMAPKLPPKLPGLSLPRFLSTSAPVLPSTASSLAAEWGPQPSSSPRHEFNSLQLLRCPARDSVLAFFPTGENCDQVGYSLLHVKELNLTANRFKNGKLFLVNKHKLNHRVTRLLVTPVADFDDGDDSSYSVIGYILACTLYSVHWFVVKMNKVSGFFDLDYAGCEGMRLFKGSAVVYACWSPHLREESLVLLGSGELFLFDVGSCLKNQKSRPVKLVVGKKLPVSWKEYFDLVKNGEWISCEFSWHPRILIVCCSRAVFLCDLRPDGGKPVSLLLKIEALAAGKDDRFAALTKVGLDGFRFAVSSNILLILCDVRRPLIPLLRWVHNLDDPCHIVAFRLSQLRSNPKDGKYGAFSDSGYCILLGSLWNCEFSLFCCGPDCSRRTVFNEISRICYSLYAWGLPSEILLSGTDCHCGSCLLKEKESRKALPDWVDWREKKEIVLGFSILDEDLSFQLSEPHYFGGFSLIRLMSSGKLEAQGYHAVWEDASAIKRAHHDTFFDSQVRLLFDLGDNEYHCYFRYLELDYLRGYLDGNLDKILSKKKTKVQKVDECVSKRHSITKDGDFHQSICQKLEAYGLCRLKSSVEVADVLKDIRLPTSIRETSLTTIWTGLPKDLLQLAFSNYLKFGRMNPEESLEFLDIPEQPHLPPFILRMPSCRSSKWSNKNRPSGALVGPVIPPHFLISRGKVRFKETDACSAEADIKQQCSKVMEVANKLRVLSSCSEILDSPTISLGDTEDFSHETDDQLESFALHKPLALVSKYPCAYPSSEKSGLDSACFTTFIFKKNRELVSDFRDEVAGPELFDMGCPLELKFGDHKINFEPLELKAFKLLKKQELIFQEGFHLYREYISKNNLQKQDLPV